MTSTPWGGLVSYRASTESTMDDAQILEDSGVPEGSVAWAGFQSAGRGRHQGRTWQAAAGDSLLFTVYWSLKRFRVPEFAPSLTVGLGVCFWLEELGLSSDFPIALKWPNDVYLGERKTAGILVRRRWSPSGPRAVHAGIGVNLVSPQGGEFRTPPTSLSEAGRVLLPEAALEGLLPALAQAMQHPDPRSACAHRLWRRDRALSISLPDGRVLEGVPRDLDEKGSLIWEGPGGLEVLSSGE